jgi:uncharacterized membrane protein YqaE (UPF0057 family)
MKKLFLLGFTASLLAVSCTVQKRLHNPGYHVTWKSKYQSADKNEVSKNENNQNEAIENSEDVALNENAKAIENEPFVIINSKKSNDSFSYTSNKTKRQNETFLNNSSKSLIAKNQENKVSKHAAIKKIAKKASRSSSQYEDDILFLLLLVLCFVFPPLAVAIASGFDLIKILISIILTILFWLPGIIYALYVVLTEHR